LRDVLVLTVLDPAESNGQPEVHAQLGERLVRLFEQRQALGLSQVCLFETLTQVERRIDQAPRSNCCFFSMNFGSLSDTCGSRVQR
jgi:hypothetical protein